MALQQAGQAEQELGTFHDTNQSDSSQMMEASGHSGYRTLPLLAEVGILVYGQGHVSVDPERGDAVVETGGNLLHAVPSFNPELVAPEVGALEEAGAGVIAVAVPGSAVISVGAVVTVSVMIAIPVVIAIAVVANLKHLDGGNAVIPAVAGPDLVALQVGDIVAQAEARSSEVAIPVDVDFGAAKDADRGNLLVKAWRNLADSLACP